MAQVEVTVDVELDEFSTEEIVIELCGRAKKSGRWGQDKLTEKHLFELQKALYGEGSRNQMSVIDEIKVDIFMSNLTNIDLDRLESII